MSDNYRVISGWSYWEGFAALEDARRRRDEMRAGDPVWKRDELFLEPTIFALDETGHYLTAVD